MMTPMSRKLINVVVYLIVTIKKWDLLTELQVRCRRKVTVTQIRRTALNNGTSSTEYLAELPAAPSDLTQPNKIDSNLTDL